MDNSIIFSAFALIISLCSLWQSHKTSILTKNVAAAEKRTSIHSALTSALIEVEDLHRIVKEAINYKGDDFIFPDGLETIESELIKFVEKIPGRLHWLRSKKSEDSILLEEYKSEALALEARIMQIGPIIRGLNVRTRNK